MLDVMTIRFVCHLLLFIHPRKNTQSRNQMKKVPDSHGVKSSGHGVAKDEREQNCTKHMQNICVPHKHLRTFFFRQILMTESDISIIFPPLRQFFTIHYEKQTKPNQNTFNTILYNQNDIHCVNDRIILLFKLHRYSSIL